MMLKKELILVNSQTNKIIDFNAMTADNCASTTLIQHEKECWLLENQHAITVYNQHIIDHGVFSDGLRCF